MKNLFFVKTLHDITTKIQHKVGFVNTQNIVGFKSVSIEVYFGRENFHEISSGQIGYCACTCLAQKMIMVQIPHKSFSVEILAEIEDLKFSLNFLAALGKRFQM